MVLDNILGITDPAELSRIEEKISKRRAKELFDKGILETLAVGKFDSFRTIHKCLFKESEISVNQHSPI